MNHMKILVFFTSVLSIPPRDGRDGLDGVSVEYLFFGAQGAARCSCRRRRRRKCPGFPESMTARLK